MSRGEKRERERRGTALVEDFGYTVTTHSSLKPTEIFHTCRRTLMGTGKLHKKKSTPGQPEEFIQEEGNSSLLKKGPRSNELFLLILKCDLNLIYSTFMETCEVKKNKKSEEI